MLPATAKKAARAAGLHYASDSEPGIARTGAPGRFHYSQDGRAVRDKKTLARIQKLAIPPAWKHVWIAASPSAHLQATGRDAKGRKQYRYHAEFAVLRDADKYAHMIGFARALPAIRKKLRRDLKQPGLPREKVLAATVALLEQTLIRVGNEDYARANDSFGLTTLRNRHVKVRGEELSFLFKGKSGKQWRLSVKDRRVAKVIRSTQDLPGQHLLEYRNGDGTVHAITSSDVNDWLRDASGRDITAKDFRTWAGTVKAAALFQKATSAKSVIAEVADALGNTVAVCRKCYIHPAVIEAFEAEHFPLRLTGKSRGGLSPMEQAVVRLLRRG